MKYQTIAKELNNALDSAARTHHKHKEQLRCFLEQFQSEEQRLLRKLQKENSRVSREKLEKELDTVYRAYTLLGA